MELLQKIVNWKWQALNVLNTPLLIFFGLVSNIHSVLSFWFRKMEETIQGSNSWEKNYLFLPLHLPKGENYSKQIFFILISISCSIFCGSKISILLEFTFTLAFSIYIFIFFNSVFSKILVKRLRDLVIHSIYNNQISFKRLSYP